MVKSQGMFLRFSKGYYESSSVYLRTMRKCVFLGNSLVMEYGNSIVGIATLHQETPTCCDYDIVVAGGCPLGAERIARFIKDTIGKSNKFTDNPSTKRRKYYVEEVDCDVLPVNAEIRFTRSN